MAKQLYYEDVEVGAEISPIIMETSTRQSVEWAIANEDPDPIHYDKEYAVKASLPSAIVNGRFKFCLLIRMVTEWMGEGGNLRTVECQHRGMDIIGEPITVKGRVSKKYIEEGEHCVECEIWAGNPKGQRTAPGSATVTLPSRSSLT